MSYTWTNYGSRGVEDWRKAACSTDGMKVALLPAGKAYIYTSEDKGVSWTQRTGITGNARCLAMSSDGLKIVVGTYGNYINRSTDGGVTWNTLANSGLRQWRSISSSPDGVYLIGGVETGHVYTSADSGATWTERQPSGATERIWAAVVATAGGVTLYAFCYSSTWTYKSVDSGATWAQITALAPRQIVQVVASDDGVVLHAATDTYVFSSLDSGATWVQRTALGTGFIGIGCSSDGAVCGAAKTGYSANYVQLSTDSGATWVAQTTTGGSIPWETIACSKDGTVFAAVDESNLLYIGVLDVVIVTELDVSGGAVAGGTAGVLYPIVGSGGAVAGGTGKPQDYFIAGNLVAVRTEIQKTFVAATTTKHFTMTEV